MSNIQEAFLKHMMDVKKISAPRLIFDNSSIILYDEKGIPLPKSYANCRQWFIIFYNYINLEDIQLTDVFIKSDMQGIDIEKQLIPDKIKQPIYSLAREVDEMKPLVKKFADAFLKYRKQYKYYRVYYKCII